MTTLREAAQQALEACEQRLPLKGQAAIIDELNNLRAALADQDRGWYTIDEINAKFAPESVQEPFGYLWPTGRHPEFRYTQQRRDGVDGMPLYNAPPQRKPLSDIELARIWDDALDHLDPRDQLRFVARAIERAHGIGGQP